MRIVRNELLPALPPDLDSRIVDFNGSDKGYLDLALIAKCGYVIASIGSLGVYGAFLGNGLLITPKYNLGCIQAIDNVIYINEDRSQPHPHRLPLNEMRGARLRGLHAKSASSTSATAMAAAHITRFSRRRERASSLSSRSRSAITPSALQA